VFGHQVVGASLVKSQLITTFYFSLRMQRIWLTIRRIGLEIYCFLTAPFVLKNCLGMFSFVLAMAMLTLWWLQCYTNHGESVEVPNYVGTGIREAMRNARSRHFEVEIADSLYLAGKAPGEVITQSPLAGSQVKEGRTLYFTIAKGAADLVRVPGLIGNEDYELFSKQCSRLGIKTRIASRQPNAQIDPNTILAVIHRGDTVTNEVRRGGYQVEMGATLDFVVTEAANNTTPIPECRCQTYDAARFLLESSGLSVGAVIKDASVTSPATAYVWKQTPAYDPNGTVRLGQAIDLFLTQELPSGCQ
jgi:beta-lactam-binding protein with PASTA domain